MYVEALHGDIEKLFCFPDDIEKLFSFPGNDVDVKKSLLILLPRWMIIFKMAWKNKIIVAEQADDVLMLIIDFIIIGTVENTGSKTQSGRLRRDKICGNSEELKIIT